MKVKLLYFLVLLTMLGGLFISVKAEGLPPIPLNVPLPGSDLTTVPDEPIDYIRSAYFWLIGFGALMALAMIVFGAVAWITSAGFPAARAEAMSRIKYAIFGLVLLLGAITILATFNEEILTNTKINEPVEQITREAEAERLRRQAELDSVTWENLPSIVDRARRLADENAALGYRIGNFKKQAEEGGPGAEGALAYFIKQDITKTTNHLFDLNDEYDDQNGDPDDFRSDAELLARHLKAIEEALGSDPFLRQAYADAVKELYKTHSALEGVYNTPAIVSEKDCAFLKSGGDLLGYLRQSYGRIAEDDGDYGLLGISHSNPPAWALECNRFE